MADLRLGDLRPGDLRLADLRPLPLFDGLDDTQLTDLIGAGLTVTFGPGEVLWREGEPAEFWWVLADGTIDLLRRGGAGDTVLGQLDVPGRWAGGFRAWDPEGVYLATGRASAPGRLLRVPAAVLRDVLGAFPLVSHLIDGLTHTARSLEAGARQRESLIALGRLSAGLAHELNNPASAATRAVDALAGANADLLASLARLAQEGLTAEQFIALDALRAELDPAPTTADPLASLAHEEALADWMSAHAVPREWALAPVLAAADADADWLERLALVVRGSCVGPALEWIAATVTVTTLLAEVKESTRRISELVGAVKAYSQLDRAARQQVDVSEGLESTLVMLGHRLRDGVAVVREYEPALPRIEAYAGELNQVWTNLLDNALDAIDGAGTLRVAARTDGDGVLVEIADTGPGMPPEVVDRAFDAFFTTKEVGKGTGLGLDIARRIVVERHHGEITIDSSPRGTVLRVALPAVATGPGGAG